ncbi:MAG TPA: hypothetical protein VD996_09450 [Chitinophagaceae bacterium]|nr:hypothetical protein [Chitinophagaceae bacterium]
MKAINIFLLFALAACLTACLNNSENNSQPGIAGHSSSRPVNVTDTSWVMELYKGSSDTIGYQSKISIEYFHQLNDSVSYCLFDVSGPTCLETYLASQVWRRHKHMQQVREGCDADLSYPGYSYSEYDHDGIQHVVTTRAYDEKVKPEFIVNVNGFDRFKEGYSMDNTEIIITDSSVTVWKVSPSGMIVGKTTGSK